MDKKELERCRAAFHWRFPGSEFSYHVEEDTYTGTYCSLWYDWQASWTACCPEGYSVLPNFLDSNTLEKVAVEAKVWPDEEDVPVAFRIAITKYYNAIIKVVSTQKINHE